MDTSKTYIKMRLTAIPYLGMGKPPEAVDEDIITGGDTYLFQSENIFIDAKGDWYYSSEAQTVQLERQDQLQEMVSDKPIEYATDRFYWLGEMGEPFNDGKTENSYWEQFISMEQLWLAFMMKEKYNKIWNGEDWVGETANNIL